MKRFLAALLGGTAGCLLVVLLLNHWRDMLEVTLDDLINATLVSGAMTLVVLAVTYAWRRSPVNVGFHTLTATLTLCALFTAPVMVFFGGNIAFLELAVIGAYGLAAGLAGGLLARCVGSNPNPPVGYKTLAAAVMVVAVLTVLNQFFPPQILPTANVARVDSSNFEREVLGSDIPVVVEFSAPWCGPCRSLAKKLDKLAIKLKGRVRFVTVDVDASPELKERYRVDSLPTALMFYQGEFKRGLYKDLPAGEVEQFFSP